MKRAIVCDWLVTAGGAERVLKHIIDCYPDADLYSVVDFFSPKDRASFLKNKKATTTAIQHFPFAKKLYRNYLPFMPLAIEQLDLSRYDLVISSSHAVAKGVLTGPDQLHVSYVHSPMRYAWDLQHQYLKESGLDHGIKGYFAKRMLHKMRAWDLTTANGVDYFIANSNFIAKRIWKTYRREAQVIYPPVDTSRFTPTIQKEDFYLTASRFVPYKKIDLIVESFSKMPDKKLIVIGDGPDMKKIKPKAGKNIELIGYQPESVLIDYMQRATAFVFAAYEDFGIVPVEAQAAGTPVIAFGKGGSLETVKGLPETDKRLSGIFAPHPTGIFFYEQSIPELIRAVELFENNRDKFTADNCAANAKRFSAEIFREKFTNYLQDKLEDHRK